MYASIEYIRYIVETFFCVRTFLLPWQGWQYVLIDIRSYYKNLIICIFYHWHCRGLSENQTSVALLTSGSGLWRNIVNHHLGTTFPRSSMFLSLGNWINVMILISAKGALRIPSGFCASGPVLYSSQMILFLFPITELFNIKGGDIK